MTIKKKAEKAKTNFIEFATATAMNKLVIVISYLGDVLKEQYIDVLTALNEIIRRCR